MGLEDAKHVAVRVAGRREEIAVGLHQMGAKLLGEIRLKLIRVARPTDIALVDGLARVKARGQNVFPQVLQIVAGVTAMTALVGLDPSVKTYVALQMRIELRSEGAFAVGARV